MKKYILATALTAMSATAFAQGYSYDNSYDYIYNQTAQPSSQPTYYENQPIYQQPYVEAQVYQAPAPAQQYQQAGSYERNWDLSVMVGTHYKEEYKGAEDSKFKAIVLPTAEYRLDPWQKLFISLDTGAGYSYALTPSLEVGGGFGYREGRDSSDASVLAGLSDIDDTVTYMAFAKYTLKGYDFGVKFEKGMDSSNDGFTTELSAGYKTRLNPQLVVGTKLATVYADDTYMEQNFGVTAAQATGFRPQSDAEAGFSEANISVFGDYTIKGPHSVMGSVKYTQLLGDAKDSSVVKDDTDLSALIGYKYTF